MDEFQLNEIKNSYYEYLAQIPNGLNNIIAFLSNDKLESALNGISNLAEGLQFLLTVEQAMKQKNIIINSNVNQAMEFIQEINTSLKNQDYILLKDIIEYELIPIFSSSSEWVFTVKGE